MTERRALLLKMLADAEHALMEAASVAAGLPDDSKAESDALRHVAEAQETVRRIERLLNKPNER